MEKIVIWFKRPNVKMFIVLFSMIFVIFMMRPFITTIVLTIIFSYIGKVSVDRIKIIFKLNRVISTLIFYFIILLIVVLSFSMFASILLDQLKNLPSFVNQSKHLKFLNNEHSAKIVKNLSNSKEVMKKGQSIALIGIDKLGYLGRGLEHILLSFFLSFIFNITFNKLVYFGKYFEKSTYGNLFKYIYVLSRRFILILGKVIETQLVICSINTILMLVGLYFIKIPNLLILGIMIFILGLVPVAGVIISLIPLGAVAFSVGGIVSLMEVMALVAVIHMFESYVLHPRLMAGATDLPVFVTFISLIVSGELMGPGGLILGIPITAFILDIMDVNVPRLNGKTNRSLKEIINDI